MLIEWYLDRYFQLKQVQCSCSLCLLNNEIAKIICKKSVWQICCYHLVTFIWNAEPCRMLYQENILVKRRLQPRLVYWMAFSILNVFRYSNKIPLFEEMRGLYFLMYMGCFANCNLGRDPKLDGTRSILSSNQLISCFKQLLNVEMEVCYVMKKNVANLRIYDQKQ